MSQAKQPNRVHIKIAKDPAPISPQESNMNTQASVVKGGHVGVVGERTVIQAQVKKISVHSGKWGVVFQYQLITPEGKKVYYTGTSFMGDEGYDVRFKAGIKEHASGDYEHFTIINRPTAVVSTKPSVAS